MRRALRHVYDVGRREHADLALGWDAYAAGVIRVMQARSRDTLGTLPPEELVHALRHAAAADLYLARCCEEGGQAAWERLHATLQPRLRGLARHKGVEEAEAADVAGEVLAELALPPPGGRARTLLGTFAGRGSLFGWLAVILVRRIAAKAKRQQPRPANPAAIEQRLEAAACARPRASDPAAATEAGETASRFRDALQGAWARCTERERLAMIFKYRDGLRQRAVAAILGVGEPRVSRLLRQALRKLSDAAKAVAAGADDPAWPALCAALQDSLARIGGGIAPPLRSDPRGGRRERS